VATIDYRTITDKPAKPDTLGDGTARRWWLEKGTPAVQGITATLSSLQEHQSARLAQHLISSRLYGNLSLLGLHAGAVRSRAASNPLLKERISYNVVQSAGDAVTSKIAKNRPKPIFLTSGGDYRQQRKAKRLNRFVEGVFYENEAYRLGVKAFRDAFVFGDGVVHVFAENGRVKFERVLASELWVDEMEGFYGEPRQMHRTKAIDRAVLLEMVSEWAQDRPKKEIEALRDEVKRANLTQTEQPGTLPNVNDLVTVRESWHLPDGPEPTEKDPKGGKHVISIEGAELFSEPYLKPFFPFARFSWCERLYGYWSQGGAEQLQNIQIEINKLLGVVQKSFHLGGTFKVFVHQGSKVVKEHITNDVGALVYYVGQEPKYVVPPLVPPEIFAHLVTLIQRAYEQVGISMLSAASQKPAGLSSGKALREFNDIESDRFMTIGQAYERFYLDLAKLAISVVKDITAGRRSYKVNAPGKRFVDTVDWKDVQLSEDSYVMQCFPVSSLPNDPAGRQQTITEWVQAGWITPRQGRRLMDFPDLDQAEGLANAAEDYLTEILERMVDEGVPTPPEPFDDLALARELALEHYARGKSQGLEEERLELLRRFLGQIDALEMEAAQKEAEAQAAQGTAGAPGPQAVPLPPPTSDLIPNVPGAQPGMVQ
jgi:hypothetical protein